MAPLPVSPPTGNELVDRLAAIRRGAGLSQRALGAALGGVRERRVSDIERARDGNPRYALVRRWLSACGALDQLDGVLALLPPVVILDNPETRDRMSNGG